ncbi:MAG TPA: fused MFS/spermidine synthase [Candidatus Anammoximicrobium sp.]|nr:fused MFS/spermidine synthase [Candidatus Anammoximicrobium sp.]
MPSRPTTTVVLFAATIFLSAALVFQVQPLIAKYVLPWFGGTPAVWTVCLLFFQIGLFFGYAYAMLTTRYVPPGWQAAVHIGLLMAALALLPITPDVRWKPVAGSDPTWRIIQLLAVSVGLPYFLLSATGPLLQAWFALVRPRLSPYPLYALSNLGSLLGLISYPFVVEPALASDQQTRMWSWCFLAFVVGCGACGVVVWRTRADVRVDLAARKAGGPTAFARPSGGQLSLWFCLAMVPSVMLLASTNLVCTDVAVVPFLWVLPLMLYLVSFILCFHDLRWCPRGFWAIAWAVMAAAAVRVLYRGVGVVTSDPIPVQVAVLFGLLFCCAMLCHGELARTKPDPAHLTTFYLTMAAGGAAGGVFVGLVAPHVFPINVEVSIAMLACTALVLIVFYRDPASRLRRGRPRWAWNCLLLAVAVLAAAQVGLFRRSLAGVQEVHRNFFGVLQVKLQPAAVAENGYVCQLIHGRTMHGMQLTDADKRRWPTAYYGPQSGIGLVLREDRPRHPRRVGVVGLGVGTLAAYARPGDHFRFYEINPAVIDLAQRFFEYLSECRGTTEVVEGDARIVLERESPQAFDLLVLDAFSSDSIPVHLLTREAFTVYLRHMQKDAILAVHISNVHLDLSPVVAGHSDYFRLAMAKVESAGDDQRQTRHAIWMLLSRNPQTLETEALQQAKRAPPDRKLMWTDQRNSLFQTLRDWRSGDGNP